MDYKGVRNLIESAFQDTKYPGDEHLVPLDWVKYPDTGTNNPTVVDTYNVLVGKEWKTLLSELENVDDLHIDSEFLYFMTLVSIKYYLPAFLIRSLQSEAGAMRIRLLRILEETGTDIPDTFKQMTNAQKQALIEYLKYIYNASVDVQRQHPQISEKWERILGTDSSAPA
jgi:hypothetical protein